MRALLGILALVPWLRSTLAKPVVIRDDKPQVPKWWSTTTSYVETTLTASSSSGPCTKDCPYPTSSIATTPSATLCTKNCLSSSAFSPSIPTTIPTISTTSLPFPPYPTGSNSTTTGPSGSGSSSYSTYSGIPLTTSSYTPTTYTPVTPSLPPTTSASSTCKAVTTTTSTKAITVTQACSPCPLPLSCSVQTCPTKTKSIPWPATTTKYLERAVDHSVPVHTIISYITVTASHHGVEERAVMPTVMYKGIDKRYKGIDKRYKGVDKRYKGIDKRYRGVDKRDGREVEVEVEGMVPNLGEDIPRSGIWARVKRVFGMPMHHDRQDDSAMWKRLKRTVHVSKPEDKPMDSSDSASADNDAKNEETSSSQKDETIQGSNTKDKRAGTVNPAPPVTSRQTTISFPSPITPLPIPFSINIIPTALPIPLSDLPDPLCPLHQRDGAARPIITITETVSPIPFPTDSPEKMPLDGVQKRGEDSHDKVTGPVEHPIITIVTAVTETVLVSPLPFPSSGDGVEIHTGDHDKRAKPTGVVGRQITITETVSPIPFPADSPDEIRTGDGSIRAGDKIRRNQDIGTVNEDEIYTDEVDLGANKNIRTGDSEIHARDPIKSIGVTGGKRGGTPTQTASPLLAEVPPPRTWSLSANRPTATPDGWGGDVEVGKEIDRVRRGEVVEAEGNGEKEKREGKEISRNGPEVKAGLKPENVIWKRVAEMVSMKGEDGGDVKEGYGLDKEGLKDGPMEKRQDDGEDGDNDSGDDSDGDGDGNDGKNGDAEDGDGDPKKVKMEGGIMKRDVGEQQTENVGHMWKELAPGFANLI
ncbi:MAG: hypothetical protein MMC23_000321 [Stictis urceolatum]|nr:hypothetical protein [Stictis urceolata]